MEPGRFGVHVAGPRLQHIDVAAHEVRKDGQPLKLTRKEFDVLWTLARHAGRIVTHRTLLSEVWGKAHEHDTQYLRVFIRQLRQKRAMTRQIPATL